jgi:hypothetical protein
MPHTTPAHAALATRIARINARASLPATQHYSNAEMDKLAVDIVRCEALFQADPETGDVPHRSKPEKIQPKHQILSLARALDHACPRSLMVNAQSGKIDDRAGSIIAHIDALSVKRSDLDRYDADIASGRALAKNRPARVCELRDASKPLVDAMAGEIRLLREGIQSKRTRTFSQKDNDPNLYRAFATSFVAAAKKDQTVLNALPELQALANTTQCHLALLDYVDAVHEVAKEMKAKPASLWDDNRNQIATTLAHAADKFRIATPEGKRTTPDIYDAFTREDDRIRRATSARDVEMACEHLKDIALTFIMGGPPNPERYGLHPRKEVPARPKIFTRISQAYKQDTKRFVAEVKQREHDKQRGRISEEGLDPINPFTIPCGLMDHVYAARWVLAADRMEALIKKHQGMLADPAIDTVPAEEKPRIDAVSEVRLKGRVRRNTRPGKETDMPAHEAHATPAAQAHSAREGRS